MSQKIKTSVEIDGSLTASQIANATTDTDKFLVSDGGTVKYRTGAELVSDLGITAGTADHIQHQVKAGVAINKGQAVYVTGANGTNIIVGLASNASEATSSKTMGLLNATVSANGFANVTTEGLLDGLNTTAATIGDPVWLGTGGNLIYGLANKPYAPNHLVFIGIVTRVHANQGEIFVKVQNGFELDEIHDVDLKTTAKINGHLLGYNGSLWVNKTIAEWLGYTPYNASNPAGYISSYTETDTLASVTARGASTSTAITLNTGNNIISTSTWEKLKLVTTGVTAAARQGSDGNGLNFTSNALWNSGWSQDDSTKKSMAYIQHLGNGRHEFRTSVSGGTVSWVTGLTIDEAGANFNVPLTVSSNTVLHAGNYTSYAVPTSGYTFGSTFSIGSMYVGTGYQGSGLTSILGAYSNGYAYQFGAAAVQSFLGLGSNAYTSTAYVPTSRTITINGTSYDLSANRSWTITGTETDTLATVTSRGASTGTAVTLASSGNNFNGHHYFTAYDANGNHYPHYNNGSNNNGSKLNLRMFDTSGNAVVFYLNGADKSIQWNGNNIWHAGNLTNLNQLANGPGYITGYTETDTLATVTSRGATTASNISVNGVRLGRDFSIANRGTIRIDANGTSAPADILFGHTSAANQSSWDGVYWSISSRAAENNNRFTIWRGGGNPSGSTEARLFTIEPSGDINIGIDSSTSQAIRLGGDNAAGGRLYFQYAGDSSYIDAYGGHGGGQRYRDLQIVGRNLNLTSSGGNVNANGSQVVTNNGGTWGINITGNSSTVSGITNNTGLLRDRLAASALIDGLTTSNFRTTLFGSGSNGYQISASRFNSVPSPLSGLNMYGTMFAWSGADTHGFIAMDYSTAGVKVGGGNGESVNWSKTLAFGDGTGASGTWGINISGNAGGSSATVTGLTIANSGNPTAIDSTTQNYIGYTNSLNLFGQSDGGLYDAAYSSSWQHQIYGDFRTGQIAIRGKNSGTWQSWRTVLDSSNVSSYAWPVEGGWKPSSLASSTRLRGATSPDGGEFALAYSGGQIHPYTDGFFYQNEGAYRVIDTNSINSYAPTPTGGNASGTWNIGITGNAATANNVNISNLNSQQVNVSLTGGYWYTIAANAGDRASAKFTITDPTSGLHQAIHFYASAHFGTLTGAKISVLSNTYYSGPPITAIRTLIGSTYDGAMVQIYANSSCTVTVSISDNQQVGGWVIRSGIISSTNPGIVQNFGGLSNTAAYVETGSGKSFSISDDIYIGGRTTQHLALHAGNYNSYAPTKTGGGASGTWDIGISGYANNAWNAQDANQLGSIGYERYIWGDGANGRSKDKTSGNANTSDSSNSSGFYFGNSTAGMPTTDWWNWLTVAGNSWSGSDGYRWQMAGSFWGDDWRLRRQTSGGWNAWYTILHSGNYNSWAPSLSGSGATGTWGIAITGNAARATRANGNFYIDDNYGNTVVGAYASTRLQGVFAMGDAYKLAADGTSASNHYGIAWSHPNHGGTASNLSSHGMLVQQAGTTMAAISTNIWCSGDVIAYSDARVKDNVKVIDNPLERIKKVRGVTFTRTDLDDKETRHAGVIAQEMREALPEVVSENAKGELSVSYGNTVSLLIECIKEQQTQIDELKELVNKLINK